MILQTINKQTVPNFTSYVLAGTSVVIDFADCPQIEQPEQNNVTYIIDPSSNLSGNFTVCPVEK